MNDTPNWSDMLQKLIKYAREELTEAQSTDDRTLRVRHLERANVFLMQASRIAETHGRPVIG